MATKTLRQYTITATRTFTFYKTVHAESIVDAHVKAHEQSEDLEDDWTCEWDSDWDDPTPENGEMVITHIEDEGSPKTSIRYAVQDTTSKFLVFTAA